MTQGFLRTFLSPAVTKAQRAYYGTSIRPASSGSGDSLTEFEKEFIGTRDSFYLATVNPDGWPYIQHRGGPPGFLQVVDAQTLAFADRAGNRQLLTTGHLAENDRIALFLMDYANRQRLKLIGHATVIPADSDPALVPHALPGTQGPEKAERIFRIRVVGISWNCPLHITPRYTVDEFQGAVAPLKQRIQDLELALKNAESGPKRDLRIK